MTLMTSMEDVRVLKGLKFCHLNVRSIVNKIDQFKLHFERSTFDVITISESWLTEDINSCLINLTGYQLLRADREVQDVLLRGTKRGGRLVTFVKRNLNFTVKCNNDRNISNSDIEIQRLELCSSVQKNILLYNVYRPPGGSISRGIDHLSAVLEGENKLHLKEVIFMLHLDVQVLRSRRC